MAGCMGCPGAAAELGCKAVSRGAGLGVEAAVESALQLEQIDRRLNRLGCLYRVLRCIDPQINDNIRGKPMLYNESLYQELSPEAKPTAPQPSVAVANPNPSSLPPLQDHFGRTNDKEHKTETEKSNLRCTYCMPEEGV